VVFRAASTTHTVCSYCATTVARSGEVLEKTGVIASVFEDYSLLQIGTQGRFKNTSFTLIGRMHYEASAGRWTEWLALLDSHPDDTQESTAILSEDNGSYVWMHPLPASQWSSDVPVTSRLILGKTLNFSNASYTVAAIHNTKLIAAQGECGKQPILNAAFGLAELRNSTGHLLSLSYDSPTAQPMAYLGSAVLLDSLKLTHLKEVSIVSVSGQAFNCPSCASPIKVLLDSSQSITCNACHSAIDLSQGFGAKLAYAVQHEPIVPQIALGSVGMIANKPWQVLGYQHRVTDVDTASDLNNHNNTNNTIVQNIAHSLRQAEDDGISYEDEQFGWEEYLLYNANLGFQFLVDTPEGWSLVRPTTTTPTVLPSGKVSYLGRTYPSSPQYIAQTDFVSGEFYWPLKRNDRTLNQDFSSGNYRLNREQSSHEITWSIGEVLSANTVMQWFNIPSEQAKHFKRDILPFGLSKNAWLWLVIVGILLLLTIYSAMQKSDTQACQEQFNPNINLSAQEQLQQCLARSKQGYSGSHTGSSWGGGGSYGGYSSGGGGHK
jgi:hypothetical protein